MRKILVTAALPYANGEIHLGHMLEYIQADIWVRFQKLIGNDCLYICGDDAHGTPIMLHAEKQGIKPEELIAKLWESHTKDFADFNIEFSNFYITHSEENKEITEQVYQRLCANDDIEKRSIMQSYDPVKNMFLPDRFVKGECPRCGAKDQYGDNCEVCGATYSPTELKNPISAISGAIPIQKESVHYFFRLDKYAKMLLQWLNSGHVQPEVAHKLNEWFKMGLKQWDISRDAPYFGFNIPGTNDKFFYVWLDAPIGYMASLKNLCAKRKDLIFDDYWKLESDTELYHFIGKDLIYFHALFWPAILESAKYRKPNSIWVHGYLTINGQKLSKSRGIFITARDYLNQLDPEYLRYYFAAKLNSHIDDIDLNLTDFQNRVNSDLVGKFVNIASRCANFINNKFADKLASSLDDENLFQEFVKAGAEISKLYENREYSHAMREIMALADKANQYIDSKKPWVLAKTGDPNVQEICSMGLNLFRILAIYLKPVLPKTVSKIEQFLNVPEFVWQDVQKPLLNHSINRFTPLLQRIESVKLNDIITPQ